MTAPAPKPPAASETPVSTGEVLPRKFGKYTLIRGLAKGGMAELYLAIHRSIAGFERLVVIKRILPEFGRDQDFITMLLQEARIAATFSHPNIVTIFDVGQAEGEYFIAMEHIHGEDLRSIVRAMKPKKVKEFPLEHALAIGLGASAGLAYAHEHKDLHGNPLEVVHRDISPQNLLVTFTGDVKVVDFGIAKAAVTRDEQADLDTADVTDSGARAKTPKPPGRGPDPDTKAGQIKGKIPYMSPEQARGDALDARSDIFSLGIILWELCTGRRLFRGPTEADTLRMITDGEYPSARAVNPRVSERLDAVLMKALHPDREQRYSAARALQGDLEGVVHAERIPVSNVALGAWMGMLFEEGLAAQRAALAEGKQLADVLAHDEPDPEPPGSHVTAVQGPMGRSGVTEVPRKTPWAVVGVLALIVLGAVAWAVLRERRTGASEDAARAAASALAQGSIELHSDPEGAHIWINDAPTPHRTPYTLRDLATGPEARFRVRLTAEGYAPYTEEVALPTRGATGRVSARLERARAEAVAVLEVNTTPPGATVLVDGRPAPGVTPMTVPGLAPGVEHTVVVRHPEMVDETFTFVGAAGRVETRSLPLRERPLGPDEAFLTLSTEPSTARVRVGDRELSGASPHRVRVTTGQPLVVVATAPGHVTETRTLRPTPGQTVAVPTLHLSRDRRPGPAAPPPGPAPVVDRTPGRLTVGSNPWCNVTIDGTSRGQTPVVNLSLPPGRHTIVCTNPERGTQTRTVELGPGQSLRVPINFP